jgi:type III pantothenate kinase
VAHCSWSDREELIDQLADWMTNGSQCVVGSVSKRWEQWLQEKAKRENIDIRFLQVRDVPKKYLNYDTPETLGIDRLLAAWGAWVQMSSPTPVIVIDAGTACTIDLMSDTGTFNGGVIAPGIRMLETGFRIETPDLPHIQERTLPGRWPGKSTAESLQWGIAGSFQAIIAGHLEHYLEQSLEEPQIWVTGGDARTVVDLLAKFNLRYDEALIFKGMHWMFRQGW